MSPELLSPAGGFDAALAAFQYGADAVYLGLPQFSARADAENLTPAQLHTLIAYARSFTPAKKVYVTFNTLVQDAELAQAVESLDAIDDAAPDGVIVQDLGVARLIRDRFPRLALHASTQLAAHNLDGVLALKAFGFTRVVLARELTLDEIRDIVRDSGVEIEIFVHGALCYSYSGLCLFSSHTAGRSGNRGRCAYCCRDAFRQTAPTGSGQAAAPFRHPFSMKDLALAPLLDRVVATGAQSLKIEGRMKSPLYVACVTDYYRRKLDGRLSQAEERLLVQDLQTIFSRPWTSLYAENDDAGSDTIIDPVTVGHRGALIGHAEAVIRDRDGTRWLRFTTDRALEKHDGLQVELPHGGKPFGCAVDVLRAAGNPVPRISLSAGKTVEVALPHDDVPMIPPGSPVFCSASQAVRRRYALQKLRESAIPSGRPVDIRVTLAPDGLTAHAETKLVRRGDVLADAHLPFESPPARQPDQTEPSVRKAFSRLGDSAWQLGTLTVNDPLARYAPPSKLNVLRREIVDRLTTAWADARAARRAAIGAAWHFEETTALPAAPQPVNRWSLKLRCGRPRLPESTLADIDTLVLAIGHGPEIALSDELAYWTPAIGRSRIRLALPVISRGTETDMLKQTLANLVADGWTDWECADFAGYRMLAERGLKPVSADWSLYAFNRVAQSVLAKLGIAVQVLSTENPLTNLRALGMPPDRAPAPELIVYQHTPLFLSETAPCLTSAQTDRILALADRHGQTFTVQRIGHRWATVQNAPFCIADRIAETGLHAFRIDLSWSPVSLCTASVVQTVRAGQPPQDAHIANFDRGLA